jgi:hypothetical protein
MSGPKPVLLGYQQLHANSSEDAAENGRRVLRAFAQREGYTIGMIFTEYVYGRMQAFDALVDAVRAGGVSAVAVPELEDLAVMPRIREAMRLRLEHAGGVRVLVVQSVGETTSASPVAEARLLARGVRDAPVRRGGGECHRAGQKGSVARQTNGVDISTEGY